MQYAFQAEILSLDQRRSLLTLLPKPGKDTRLLDNWRPLSLLNTDYKIVAKLLSIRLQNVIDTLVSEDQVGYIKGRQLGDNCRKILDVFEFSEDLHDPGYVLFLDFEKAFDSVSRDFLYKTLQAFNFGDTFLKWIRILYNEPLCIPTNNGHSSEAFVTSRGIRQGCPISSLLFILVGEVMSISLRANRNIKGITLNDVTMTITQMADDTTLFLQDLDSIKHTLDLLHHFHHCAGLKLNTHKTEAFQLGVVSNNIDSKYGLRWGSKKIKVTGVTVGKNMKLLTTALIEEKVLKVRNLLNMWKARNLTIKGKITLLRSKVVPVFLYVATIVYVPENIIKQVDDLFFDFIWPSGKHHVKKKVLIQEIESGGLKMPDISSMLKAVKLGWLKRLCVKETLYTHFASSLIGRGEVSSFMKYKCDTKYLVGVPNFYRQLFHFWYELHSRPPEGADEILDEYLWCNRSILIDKKPIFFKSWNEGGIKRISDVMKFNGLICSKEDLANEFGIHIVFWQGVSTLVQRALDINIKLYDLDIIFGLPGEDDVFQIINFCILYGKKYIFDCRINDNIVSIDRFESKLKNKLEVEIYIIDSCGIRLNTKKILLMELYNSLCS